jgi:hypothetical protein
MAQITALRSWIAEARAVASKTDGSAIAVRDLGKLSRCCQMDWKDGKDSSDWKHIVKSFIVNLLPAIFAPDYYFSFLGRGESLSFRHNSAV